MQQTTLGGSLKNNHWVTDEDEQKDPSILPELPGFHILVRPVSIKGKTKGGILLPGSTKDDIAYLTTVGKVLAIGDLAYKDIDKFPNGAWCKPGDYICYGKHTGTKLFYKGVRLLVLFDDQVMMRVQDPTLLDPTFNLTKFSS
jgi:co-chaperonin GroES (HSP10)